MSAPAATATRWKVDRAHTVVEFSVRHMMISTVKGYFRQFDGFITGDPAQPETLYFEGWAEAASVDTGEPQRDQHLRSPDFFDAERYPRLTLRSVKVTPLGNGELEVLAELTIRDVTRQVPFRVRIEGPAKDPWGNQRIALEAQARINREDFGLKWNMLLETGGLLVGKEVTLNLHVQAVKEQEPAA